MLGVRGASGPDTRIVANDVGDMGGGDHNTSITHAPSIPEETGSSASGDFCPIIWDASLPDCAKVEKLMDWLGKSQYGGELCNNPREVLEQARWYCLQDSQDKYDKMAILEKFIASQMPKALKVVDSQ